MSVEIDNPCDERWDEMERHGEGRFCARCKRTVVDLSHLTEVQAEARVARKQGRLCLALRMDARTHQPIFRPEPARAPRWAGGLVLAAALTSASCATGETAPAERRVEITPTPDEELPVLVPLSPGTLVATAEPQLVTRAVPVEELELPEDSAAPTVAQRRLTERKNQPATCALPATAAANTYMMLGF